MGTKTANASNATKTLNAILTFFSEFQRFLLLNETPFPSVRLLRPNPPNHKNVTLFFKKRTSYFIVLSFCASASVQTLRVYDFNFRLEFIISVFLAPFPPQLLSLPICSGVALHPLKSNKLSLEDEHDA